MLIQAGIAGPIVLALIVHTGANRDRSLLQRHLFWLLVMILAWMIGMVLGSRSDPNARVAAMLLMVVPTCFMAPQFCLLMGHLARVELLEQHPASRYAVLAPFGFFLLAFLSHDAHGLMADPVEMLLAGEVGANAGPLYWAFQVWSNCVAFVGLLLCARVWREARSREERRRVHLLALGAALPLAAHLAHVFHWLPLGAPLTPAALGLTALFVVAAIQRYRLLEVRPIARRDVVEASSDGVVVADVDGCVIDVNPAAVAMLGGQPTPLFGAPLPDVLRLLGSTTAANSLDRFLDAIAEGLTPNRSEVETRDGRVLEVSGGSPVDGSGARAGSFVVLRDRTNERRAERMLYQSQKLESVGILAAGVAHEVNNPLAFVRANLAHLQYQATRVEDSLDRLPKETAEELGDMQDVIGESVDGIERIHEIVQRLLRFARMPGARDEACDLNRVVRDASRFASLERGVAVQFEFDLEDGLPAVEASAEQLVQVLLNLFLNAKHALRNRPDPRIVASTRVVGDAVEIRIQDNGPGVSEELRSMIFDPFFTTRAPNEGTGLGLSIAFDIVRDHGGVLELDPAASPGACFVVRLPVASRGSTAPA